jgi:MFS transporter, SP family, xylose:H+ symportor
VALGCVASVCCQCGCGGGGFDAFGDGGQAQCVREVDDRALVGSIGYLISLGFLAGLMFYYEQARDGQFTSTSAVLVLVGLMVFIAAHAFGQGSVIWVFISEIFPNRIRGRGQSLGSLTHWVFAAITSFAFPPIIGAFGAGVAFSIFFVAMIGQLVWVLRVMPETKGVPLEEMEAKLGLTHVTFPLATERDR